MKELMFTNSGTVKSQIDSLALSLDWVQYHPSSAKSRTYLTEIKDEGTLYEYHDEKRRVVVWADKDDNLVREFHFSAANKNSLRRIILERRNDIVFNSLIGPKTAGLSRQELVALAKEDEELVALMTVYITFFHQTASSMEEKDEKLYISYYNDVFPLTSGNLNRTALSTFTIKGIPVNVTMKLILQSKIMELRAVYEITPVNTTGSKRFFTGELSLTRFYPDFKWLSSKAFLREHEDLVYHWLRDLDKESRKLDVLDEGNAI